MGLLARGASRLLRGGWAGSGGLSSTLRAFSSDAGVVEEVVDVVAIDPRFVIDKDALLRYKDDRREGSSQPMVPMSVPTAFLQELQKGPRVQLADMDDPMNYLFFGEEGELFQYKFLGTQATRSGFTSLVKADTLAAVHRGEAPVPSWEQFLEWQKEGGELGVFPFLAVGRIMEAPSASVYRMVKGKDLSGLLITSDFESVDD